MRFLHCRFVDFDLEILLHVGIRGVAKNLQNCLLDAAILLKKPHYIKEVASCLKNAGYNSLTIQGDHSG